MYFTATNVYLSAVTVVQMVPVIETVESVMNAFLDSMESIVTSAVQIV